MPTREIASQGSVNANNASKTSRYRPEIDGLRAFAVVAVIINHFNKDILPGGYLGVDIFFVISGYVITSSLFGRPSKDFKDFISGFYERRIKRLVPALSVFVLITSIAICLFNPSPDLSLRTGLTSLFGLSNLYLLKQSTDYFAQSTELNVFTHTWSLGVEEQFYILFPFLIWFSGFGRQTKHGARNLFLIVGMLTIASLVGFLHLYPTNQPAAYFLMPSRFWEMAAGCLIFIGFQKRASIEQYLERVPPLLVLALIVGVMYLPMSLAAASTIAVVALSSILIASLKKQTAVFNIFTHPRVVYIGLISYSLYLWHWGVLSISRWTIGIHWWSVPFQVALMLGLAVASYKWIETPLRKGNWFGKRWKTLVVGGGVLITVSGGIISLGKLLNKNLYLGNINCKPFQYNTCTGVDSPHAATTPFITNSPIQRDKCFLYKGVISESVIEECKILPKSNSSPTIFVIGSSYIHHLSPSFEKLHKEFGMGIVMSVVTGCDFDPLFKKTNPQGTCKESNIVRAKHLIKEGKDGDILFVGVTGNKIDESSVNAIAEIGRTKKMNVVYFSPIPTWQRLDSAINDACYQPQWFQMNFNCSRFSTIDRVEYMNNAQYALDQLSKIENSNPYFHVYHIEDILCGELRCPSHINGIRLYRDNSGHLSVHAVKEFVSDDLITFVFENKLSVR
ncbi:acyltransferase family protein [Synechococcus sp. A15-62]|uniref:acyltransferase family protein n=1 Tax=Synechococcus sp. A15-62 TaxID=1050657 RepID=UPI0018603036|nr:acyltransferase family protein [Synechococcus sp. A15-62]QNJ01469.1 acyltransferase family protein [Synechococcus sp. A15-62]